MSAPGHEGSDRRLLGVPRRLALALLAMVCWASCWALFSPLGSVPDEPAHVINSASVARGELGHGPTGTEVDVPASVAAAQAAACAAFRPVVTADCLPDLGREEGSASARTGAGRYPPLYYALVGWPTWFSFGEATWTVMRLLSVLLCGGLLWLGARSWHRDSPVLAAGLLLAGTPMVGFLAGSVNPNGAEIVAGVAFALAGTGLLDRVRHGGQLRPAAVGAALTGGYLAFARPGSWVLLVGLVAVLAVAGSGDLRKHLRSRAVVAVLAAIAASVVAALVFARLVALPPVEDPSVPAIVPLAPGPALLLALASADEWLFETVGYLGWREHAPPLSLRLLWLALASGLVALAALVGRRRERLSLLVLLVGALLVAPYAAVLTVFRDGTGYQGRYAMALTQAVPVLAAAILALHARRQGPVDLAGRALAVLPVVLAAAQLLVLGGSLLRYAVGLPLPTSPVQLVESVEWLPPLWPVCLLLAAAAVAAGVLATRPSRLPVRPGG